MKKILVFRQPFPMGNFMLNEKISTELSKCEDYSVYLLEQLNGRKPTNEYIEQIKDLDPDVIYYEMLDQETFKLLEHFKSSLKILCCTSGGILKDPKELAHHRGTYYDRIITNSRQLSQYFNAKEIPCEFFKFYVSVVDTSSLVFNPKYHHNCVFLGMGFNRLSHDTYKLERELFFNEHTDIKIYGNGWNQHPGSMGILPPGDIGTLYYSSVSAVGIIAQGQRSLGMINNRYVEIAMSKCPIISYNYPDVDWFGLEKYIYFVDTRMATQDIIKKLYSLYQNQRKEYDMHVELQQKFMERESSNFLNLLKQQLT